MPFGRHFQLILSLIMDRCIEIPLWGYARLCVPTMAGLTTERCHGLGDERTLGKL